MNKFYVGRYLIGELFDKHINEDDFWELVDIERDGVEYRVQAVKSCHKLEGEKFYTMSGYFSVVNEEYRYHFRYKGAPNKPFNDNYLQHTGSERI